MFLGLSYSFRLPLKLRLKSYHNLEIAAIYVFRMKYCIHLSKTTVVSCVVEINVSNSGNHFHMRINLVEGSVIIIPTYFRIILIFPVHLPKISHTKNILNNIFSLNIIFLNEIISNKCKKSSEDFELLTMNMLVESVGKRKQYKFDCIIVNICCLSEFINIYI